MKYQCQPVVIDALAILTVQWLHHRDYGWCWVCETEDGKKRAHLKPDMPEPGDYWIIHPDGRDSVEPLRMFLCKYKPLLETDTTVPVRPVLRKISEVQRDRVCGVDDVGGPSNRR